MPDTRISIQINLATTLRLKRLLRSLALILQAATLLALLR